MWFSRLVPSIDEFNDGYKFLKRGKNVRKVKLSGDNNDV